MNYKIKDQKLFLLLFLILFIFTTTFGAEYNVPKKPVSVDVADIDFDGDLDIVLGHEYWNDWSGISLLTNNNSGAFSLVDSIYYGGNHNSLYLVHLDNNNSYDIITEFYDDIENAGLGVMFDFYDNLYENHFFLNNGSGYFKIGDIDSDDDIDVIFYCNPFFFWGYITNSGLGQYSNPEYYNIVYPPTNAAVGHLNEDNREDIVISGQDVYIHFSYETGFECFHLGDHELRVRIADVDNDGDNDIIGLTSFGLTGITIYENLGNNNFYEHDQFFFQTNTTRLQISDLNNDGFIDLICSGAYNNGIYILYNNGGFSFSEPQYFFTGEDTRELHCDDLDNNNYNDIIALTHYTIAPDFGRLHILFNDGNGNFVEEPQVGINEKCIMNNEKCKLTNYPNPFKPSGAGRSPGTTISYELPVNIANPVIEIFNVTGEKIKTLYAFPNRGLGTRSVVWDGTDNYRKQVSSGVYLYRLKTDDFVSKTKKMILLK